MSDRRNRRGAAHHRWKGGRSNAGNGYMWKNSGAGQRYEHIQVAEKAFGGPLPPKVVVHHHDKDKKNNANTNLVICENQKYHRLLHHRMRILEACGDPNSQRICSACSRLLNLEEFYKNPRHLGGRSNHCKVCSRGYFQRWAAKQPRPAFPRPSLKLTETQVIEIRLRYSQGETLRALAPQFGVGFVCAWNVVNRKTWKRI